MKTAKKLIALMLSLALILPLGFIVSNAADSITITLRIEQDDNTLLSQVPVTLTEEDKNNDFGIGLSTGRDAALSPLRAYAKYLSQKGVSPAEMKKYIIASPSEFGGLYVTGLSPVGDGIGSPSTKEKNDVYWMYRVNNSDPGVSMSDYNLSNADSVVIYGIWSPYPAEEETLYSAFDKESILAENNQVSVTLRGYGSTYDENWNATPFVKPIESATVTASHFGNDIDVSAASPITAKTNAKGEAVINFPKADTEMTYVLSAYKMTKDGIHSLISRPYAKVTVAAGSKKASVSDLHITKANTPYSTKWSGILWRRSFTKDKISYNSVPVIHGKKIYVVNKDKLYELGKSGKILRKKKLCAAMNSVCSLYYNNGFLYIPLDGGRIQCIRCSDFKSIWSSESFGGQSLSTICFHNGYLYSGTTKNAAENTSGTFYCLRASDGKTMWTYEDKENPGGYYWSGATVSGNAVFFAGDNGILVSHSLLTDEVYDTYTLTETGKIRAAISCDEKGTALYTTSNNGSIYRIVVTPDGKIDSVLAREIISYEKSANCTSTPVICNNRLYVGSIADGTGYIHVLDAGTLKRHYSVSTGSQKEVKASPLVSTAYSSKEKNGAVYVYFTCNALPGALYMIKDSETAKSSSLKTICLPEEKQFCISGVAAGADGTLYYSNDSGNLYAIGSIRTVKKPTKVSCKKKKGKWTLSFQRGETEAKTHVYVRYNSGKWKKIKTLSTKTKVTFSLKKKKKIYLRLRNSKKTVSRQVYSAYTKTYRLH